MELLIIVATYSVILLTITMVILLLLVAKSYLPKKEQEVTDFVPTNLQADIYSPFKDTVSLEDFTPHPNSPIKIVKEDENKFTNLEENGKAN